MWRIFEEFPLKFRGGGGVVLRRCHRSRCHSRMVGMQTAPNNLLRTMDTMLADEARCGLAYTRSPMDTADYYSHYSLLATNEARCARRGTRHSGWALDLRLNHELSLLVRLPNPTHASAMVCIGSK